MNLIEKPWTYGTRLAYSNVEESLLEINVGDRVLPARYYYEKKLYITLVKKYLPGEYKGLPNGGYHCRMDGAGYWFEPDEVILHPFIIAQRRKRVKWEKKVEKIKAKNNRPLIKAADGSLVRKRGRPSLPPEIKEARDKEKLEKSTLSKGKRGRPPGSKNNKSKVYTPKTNTDGSAVKRGRKPLPPEIKALRDKELELRKQKSGGKRGRPSNPAAQAAKQALIASRLLLNPERKRGRPRFS